MAWGHDYQPQLTPCHLLRRIQYFLDILVLIPSCVNLDFSIEKNVLCFTYVRIHQSCDVDGANEESAENIITLISK